MLKELRSYRKYILNNAIGEIKFRYAGSAIGVFWNVLNPLFQIVVFTVVFSNIMIAKLPGMENTGAFAVYLCSGLLAWSSFSECISRGTNAFLENSTLLKKLPIPEHVFVLQTAVSSFLNSLISYSVLAVFVALLNQSVGYSWLISPFILVLFQLFGLGIALISGTLNIFFRDITHFVGVFMSMWMWLTPIVYVKEILPDSFKNIYKYNPAYPFIESLHEVIVYNRLPDIGQWSSMVIISSITLLVGYLILVKLRMEIRDNL
jgi:lipopolysaccharide transport system permease protein